MFSVIPFCDLFVDVKDSLYSVRKETFHDRLGWDVKIDNGREFDDFDNTNATYLLGVVDGRVFAGVRFCYFSAPNMLDGPFSRYFSTKINHSNDVIESSRFFVDNNFVKTEIKSAIPITKILFISMFCFCSERSIKKIIAVVSKAMLRIVRKNGWQYEVIEESVTESKDKIFLIAMMITELSYTRLSEWVE